MGFLPADLLNSYPIFYYIPNFTFCQPKNEFGIDSLIFFIYNTIIIK